MSMSNSELKLWPGREQFGFVQKVGDKERPKTTWAKVVTCTKAFGQDELLIGAHSKTGVNGKTRFLKPAHIVGLRLLENSYRGIKKKTERERTNSY